MLFSGRKRVVQNGRKLLGRFRPRYVLKVTFLGIKRRTRDKKSCFFRSFSVSQGILIPDFITIFCVAYVFIMKQKYSHRVEYVYWNICALWPPYSFFVFYESETQAWLGQTFRRRSTSLTQPCILLDWKERSKTSLEQELLLAVENLNVTVKQ